MKKKILISVMLLAMAITITSAITPGCQSESSTALPTDSTAVILEKAKTGDAAAQNTVGVWYYTGKDSIKQNYEEALKWWARSARQDNPDAIGNMAMCYQLGRGTERDTVKAMSLYEIAIKKGNENIIPQHEKIVENTKSVFSSLLLNKCYSQGIGVQRNQEQAMKYLEVAAEGGNVDSQFSVGLYYLNKKQHDKAVEWFRRAAIQDNTAAIYHYGNLLFKGLGIAQDKQKGRQYMEIAGNRNFATACYQLGNIYLNGDGVEKDDAKAISYLKKAVAKRNLSAAWLLATCYLNGVGVTQDYYFATQWFAEVALLSHKNQFSELLTQDNNGTYSMYLMGLRKYFVEKNYDAAIDYFKKVEKAKNVEGITMQALCLANKDNKDRNLKKAVKLFKKAAENSPVANYYLAMLYETGTGVDKDDKLAVELMSKAAEGGVAYAQCRLGDRYMSGAGVTKDLVKAATLYLQAEGQNHLTPQSAKNLAECYRLKLACLPDLQDAEKRIEKLEKQKDNINLTNLLRALEE